MLAVFEALELFKLRYDFYNFTSSASRCSQIRFDWHLFKTKLFKIENCWTNDEKSSIQFWFYLEVFSIWGRIAFLLNQYLIMFQKYLGFCNMQMRCLMTSPTQHRPNKLLQMRNISNEEYLCTLDCTFRISIAAKFQYNLPIISVDIPPLRN